APRLRTYSPATSRRRKTAKAAASGAAMKIADTQTARVTGVQSVGAWKRLCRRLARAVRPEEAVDVARVNRQVDPVDADDVAVAFAQPPAPRAGRNGRGRRSPSRALQRGRGVHRVREAADGGRRKRSGRQLDHERRRMREAAALPRDCASRLPPQ